MNTPWNTIEVETLVHYYFYYGKNLWLDVTNWSGYGLTKFGEGTYEDDYIILTTFRRIYFCKLDMQKGLVDCCQ